MSEKFEWRSCMSKVLKKVICWPFAVHATIKSTVRRLVPTWQIFLLAALCYTFNITTATCQQRKIFDQDVLYIIDVKFYTMPWKDAFDKECALAIHLLFCYKDNVTLKTSGRLFHVKQCLCSSFQRSNSSSSSIPSVK